MDEVDFARIEAELGVRLPAAYRSTMLAYPFPRDSDAAEFWLRPAADDVIEDTRLFRREFWAPGAGRRPWPAHLLYLGSDGGGGAYFLDLSREPAPVLELLPGANALTELAPDLPSWLPMLQRSLDGISADEALEAVAEERERRERHGRRPWWRLW